MPSRPHVTARTAQPEEYEDEETEETPRNPAAALAGVLQQRTGTTASSSRQPQYTPEASDEEAPAPSLPRRPESQQLSPPPTQYTSPSPRSPEPGMHASASRGRGQSMVEAPISPSGYHMYNINEMISHLGKNRKMPTTLGINVGRGTILIAPEKSRDGPQQEWTAEKLTHYSIEGKHVFVELVRPSKSIDFHAGAKDTAQEITAALGELAGAARAGGVTDLFASDSGHKKGHMVYEFMAAGEDEVTVAEGDEVIVLDDSKSEEWWMVRRLKNGKEGVVPRQYVEITGVIGARPDAGLAQARSTVEQNRLEEERLTREAVEASEREKRKSKRQNRADRSGSDSKPKPNPSNVRTWTDRSGSFKVDAEFLGLKDGKIHMHKTNGVKIAVAVSRMSSDDIEYVERMTGQSLEEDKPLSEVQKRERSRRSSPRPANGAAFQAPTSKYDWFDFFLQCGVNPQICDRYAHAFDRDQMGEENLADIQPTLLRTLGLREGDILRVMKHLDEKFGRQRNTASDGTDGTDGGGIFSGPGGALRNNTRKGRPAPTVSNNDTVDPRAFEQSTIKKDVSPEPASPVPASTTATSHKSRSSGFDDDAWNVKPSKQPSPAATNIQSPPSAPQITAPAPQKPAPTGAMGELSLLSPPLQPQQAAPPPQPQLMQQNPVPAPQAPQAPQVPQPTGADRSFFDQLGAPQPLSQLPNQPYQQTSIARQRPAPPPQPQSQNSFMTAPPTNRSASAPNNQQPSAFAPPPLQPQMTGYQSQPALPGQSLNDLTQQRFQQQQFLQTQQLPTLQPQPTSYGFPNQPQNQPPQQQFQQPMVSQPTGFYPQQPQPQSLQPQAQQFLAQKTGSPFADPPRAPFQPQPTSFQQTYPQQPLQPQATGINSMLPAPLQPQPTGAGFGGFGPQPNGFAQPAPPVPPLPSMPSMPQQMPAPLQAQKTGPAPPVQFGLQPANKLTPQPTGKANLANASKSLSFRCISL